MAESCDVVHIWPHGDKELETHKELEERLKLEYNQNALKPQQLTFFGKLLPSRSSFLSVTKVSQNATFFLPWQGICDIIPHGVKIHTQENSSVEVKIPFLRR